MCEARGLGGKHSNHSLRSTAATRLYQNSVEEQQIANLTRHCSVVVRNYKHTPVEQKKELSDLLYNNKKAKSCTVSSPEFGQCEIAPEVLVTPEIKYTPALSTMLPVEQPQIEINLPKITVNPVINL